MSIALLRVQECEALAWEVALPPPLSPEEGRRERALCHDGAEACLLDPLVGVVFYKTTPSQKWVLCTILLIVPHSTKSMSEEPLATLTISSDPIRPAVPLTDKAEA